LAAVRRIAAISEVLKPAVFSRLKNLRGNSRVNKSLCDLFYGYYHTTSFLSGKDAHFLKKYETALDFSTFKW
jgi:hypothetical protein